MGKIALRLKLVALMLMVAAQPFAARAQSPDQTQITEQTKAGNQTDANITNSIGPNVKSKPATDGIETRPETVEDGVYGKMFKALFAAFVLAVVIESALALIFNWRPFLLYFDGRGVRSLIAFLVSLLVASTLSFDLIERLHEANGARDETPSTGLGLALTALVLAGGSAGVNNLLRSFGFRQLHRREEIAPRPRPDDAWIAVRLTRQHAVGQVAVKLERPGPDRRLVGIISGTRTWPKPVAWALTDPMRFPPVAGFPVKGGEEIAIHLVGRDARELPIDVRWGPHVLEAGAVVDIELKL